VPSAETHSIVVTTNVDFFYLLKNCLFFRCCQAAAFDVLFEWVERLAIDLAM